MDKVTRAKLDSVFRECDAHVQRLRRASGILEAVFPLTEKSFNELTEERITLIDQFLYRFIKLQDSMGTRLIPVIAGLIVGNNDPRPFIDNLNILEKNRVIISAEEWQEMRNIRNRLAHEYPDSSKVTVSSLNSLMAGWTVIEAMYHSINRYFIDKLQ